MPLRLRIDRLHTCGIIRRVNSVQSFEKTIKSNTTSRDFGRLGSRNPDLLLEFPPVCHVPLDGPIA